jgi:hypothetical protein
LEVDFQEWNPELSLRLLASEIEVPLHTAVGKSKVKRKLRKRWLAARFTRCFGTSTKKLPRDAKMNTKKAASNKNNPSIEESARRGSVDFIFCGIHTFKFIDHANQDGKDLTSPFPPGGIQAAVPNEIGVQPAVPKQSPQNRTNVEI